MTLAIAGERRFPPNKIVPLEVACVAAAYCLAIESHLSEGKKEEDQQRWILDEFCNGFQE